MARERTYTEVLNLRIDEPLNREIERIAAQRGQSASDTARMLLGWGVRAHRAMEARLLMRPYDYEEPTFPQRMVIDVHWEEIDPDEASA
jgi:hypothetical protein